MRTVFGRTTRLMTAGIAAMGMSMAGCPPHAAALPTGFPDLSGYAPVDVDNFVINYGRGLDGQFVTPYNIGCRFIAGVNCWGTGIADPAKKSPPPCWWGNVTEDGTAGFKEDHWEIATGQACESMKDIPTDKLLLRPGQKLTYQDVTCAVGVRQMMVACLDTSAGQHGFVLKPSGNVVF